MKGCFSYDHRRFTEPRPKGTHPEVFDDYADVALRHLRRANRWWKFWSSPWLTTFQCECPGWVLRELVDLGEVEFRKREDNTPNEWRILDF